MALDVGVGEFDLLAAAPAVRRDAVVRVGRFVVVRDRVGDLPHDLWILQAEPCLGDPGVDVVLAGVRVPGIVAAAKGLKGVADDGSDAVGARERRVAVLAGWDSSPDPRGAIG